MPAQVPHSAARTGAVTPISRHAEGSCLIRMGNAEVPCAASVEGRVPPFLRNSGMGWVTAEFGMLSRAAHTRARSAMARLRNPDCRKGLWPVAQAPAPAADYREPGTRDGSLARSDHSSLSRCGPYGFGSTESDGCAIGRCSILPSTASCAVALS